MKKILTFFAFILITMNGFAQQPADSLSKPAPVVGDTVQKKPITHEPFTFVQEMPTFPGGDEGVKKYLSEHFDKNVLPDSTMGRIIVRFVVEADGSLSRVTILKGMSLCESCNKEAIRVVSSMPKWNPGRQNGHPVAVWYTVPFSFK